MKDTALGLTGGGLFSMGALMELADNLQVFTMIGGFFIMLMTLIITFNRMVKSFKDDKRD